MGVMSWGDEYGESWVYRRFETNEPEELNFDSEEDDDE